MKAPLPAVTTVVLPAQAPPGWKHLSTAAGELPVPNAGTQQTSATVFDIDLDGR